MASAVQEPALRIRSLSSRASVVNLEASIPVKRYYRSGIEMERVANVYYSEGNLEHAFILYSKFITLFLEKLPQHPSYKESTKEEKAKRKEKLKVVLTKAEEVKKKLEDRFVREFDVWLATEEKRKAVERERQMREEEEKRIQRQKEEEEKERRRTENEERAERGEEERRMKQEEKTDPPPPSTQPPTYTDAVASEGFVVPFDRGPEAEDTASVLPIAQGMAGLSLSGPAPSAPAYFDTGLQPLSNAYQNESSMIGEEVQRPAIDRSTKPPPLYQSGPSFDRDQPVAMPTFDRSAKPPDRLNSITSLEDLDPESTIDGLRRIFVPGDLMREFERIAMSNTLKNIETCGILAGKLRGKAFYITHILVPKQEGTTDSCTTVNEEDLFEYQDGHDLITLGWIHTHPTQTSFLSSVDLHTHCGYQLMMDEAIAIVCAPKHQQIGIYNLTRPYGLRFVSSCRKTGFHPHPKDPKLFQDCAHVTVEASAPVIVHDFRFR